VAELAPPPTFLVLGFARNATRWLRANLDRHPDVFAPPIDTGFFTDGDRMAALGHRWYREQFSDWRGQTLIGECSPSYLSLANSPGHIADRIRKHLPGARLIAIVGNPCDRFQSALRHHVRWGRLPATPDVERLYLAEVEPELCFKEVSEGMQALSIDAYQNRVGTSLLVLSMDDVRRDPAGVYRAALDHIGADPSFVPDDLGVARFSDRRVVDVADPSLEARRRLYSWYRGDVELLGERMGQDLTGWDPGVSDDGMNSEDLAAALMVYAADGKG